MQEATPTLALLLLTSSPVAPFHNVAQTYDEPHGVFRLALSLPSPGHLVLPSDSDCKWRINCVSLTPTPPRARASFRVDNRNTHLTNPQLIEHLPHSVNGVGEELARGDPDLEPFYAIGKVKPSELLGFVVVGWMLEGSGQSGAHDEDR